MLKANTACSPKATASQGRLGYIAHCPPRQPLRPAESRDMVVRQDATREPRKRRDLRRRAGSPKTAANPLRRLAIGPPPTQSAGSPCPASIAARPGQHTIELRPPHVAPRIAQTATGPVISKQTGTRAVQKPYFGALQGETTRRTTGEVPGIGLGTRNGGCQAEPASCGGLPAPP